MAWVIGALAIVLLAGSSAFGQFVVQPMKVTLQLLPGRRTVQEVVIENVNPSTTETIDFSIVDVTQDADGMWTSIEPDSPVDRSKLRSCESWLRLGRDHVQVAPYNRVPVQLMVDVPAGTRGYYCAAILARTLLGREEIEGLQSDILLEFVVPVIIEVQGRPMLHDIKLVDMDLEFRPQTMTDMAASLVTMKIKNDGGTYSLLKGWARIWAKFGGHWRKLTETEFRDASIIPGSEFTLRQDVGRALPRGEYKVEGFLIVDGARADQLARTFEFAGDPRVMTVKGDAALDLDPPELFVETLPGQQRVTPLMVVNASEEAVTVEVEVDLPDHLKMAAWGSLRGPEFGCCDWLDIAPKQFTLQGYQRMNLRVISRMPSEGATNPDYYAMIRLRTRYMDGQNAGVANARICVTNKTATGTARIEGMRLVLSESSPGRYLVTAQFGNFGTTHIQPTCRAYLTAVPGNSVEQGLALSSQQYDKTGILLPLETRSFTGVLDVTNVDPGVYRLTAVLLHERGGAVQYQTALEVTGTSDRRMIQQRDVKDVGGVTTIEL